MHILMSRWYTGSGFRTTGSRIPSVAIFFAPNKEVWLFEPWLYLGNSILANKPLRTPDFLRWIEFADHKVAYDAICRSIDLYDTAFLAWKKQHATERRRWYIREAEVGPSVDRALLLDQTNSRKICLFECEEGNKTRRVSRVSVRQERRDHILHTYIYICSCASMCPRFYRMRLHVFFSLSYECKKASIFGDSRTEPSRVERNSAAT